MFEIVILIFVLLILFVAGSILFGRLRTKGQIQRSLNMTLFLVRIPREKPDPQDQRRQTDKELISVGEQLLSSFAVLHSKGWNKLIYGEPYLALEMAVHHVGEEIHFYIAAPKANADLIEKTVHSFYPESDVERVNDYNIFNPDGAHSGAYLKYKESRILPIKTYANLETDPLSAILTSMSKLRAEGEGVALQLLIRPAHNTKMKDIATKTAREMQSGYHFQQALYRAKHPPKEGSEDKDKQKGIFNPATAKLPQVVTPGDEEVIKSIVSKANKQLFDTNIRVVTSAETQSEADRLLKELESSFVQYSAPDVNTFIFSKVKKRALNKLLYNFSFRLFNKAQTIILSTEEINSIYHLPLPTTTAPKVKSLKSKGAEPPAELPTSGINVGKNRYRGLDTMVYLTENDRRRHVYIIGQTGTGKSSLMKHMIEQDLQENKGLCIIEPHGDFAEHALSVIPPDRAEDVIYFNPADMERPLGLNILEFDPNHPEQKTLLINELLAIIDKLYNLKETGGPLFEKYFKNSCLLLMDDYQADPSDESKMPLLSDISRVLVDEDFRKDKLSREPDPLVRQFWKLEAEKAGGESSLANMAPYISSKIDTFISSDFLRPIINQKRSSIDFREVIDSGKILIVSLSKGRIGETNAQLLGMMIVAKLLAASLSRVDIPEDQRNDFYLYMDEFQNVTTDSIATILSEARKYRLNLTIAHQFIKQLQEPIRDAVFGNVGSIVAFRIGTDDGEFMKGIFEPRFSKQDLSNIDNFNAHVKLLINGKTSDPFTIETIKESEGSPEQYRQIIELSRQKYGSDRAKVEAEIRRGFEAEY